MKKSGKKVKRENKGITLIALVVTIVVLLILAGVSIATLTGPNGILTQANDAKTADEKGETEDRIKLVLGEWQIEKNTNKNNNLKTFLEGKVPSELDKVTDNGDGTYTVEVNGYKATVNANGQIEGEITEIGKITPPTGGTKVADVIGKPASSTNQEITDEFQNKITIPAGFTIVANGTESEIISKVVYSKDIPTVMDGIVIQDSEGNQFVWVPVGDIKTDNNGTTKTINLSRYEFADGTSNYTDKDGKTYTAPAKGTPIDKGETAIFLGSENYTEDTTTGANTHALDINNFKTNSKNKGGYYIARYEASYGTDGKANSKKSVGTPAQSKPSTYTEGQLWNWITQPNAAIASQNMYKGNTNYTSDLINSYAWDTAIVFIQTFSTGNSEYSRKTGTSINSQLVNTGINNDRPLNIYDMAGNTFEWSTETCSDSGRPCTHRGGLYNLSGYYTSVRNNYNTTDSINKITFRPLLYLFVGLDSVKTQM